METTINMYVAKVTQESERPTRVTLREVDDDNDAQLDVYPIADVELGMSERAGGVETGDLYELTLRPVQRTA